MSYTEMLMIFGLKPLVICCLITMFLSSFKKESASFQFSVIWLSLFFIPLSVFLSLLTGFTLEFQLPFKEVLSTPASGMSLDNVLLIFSCSSFVSLYLLFYRWLGFIVLANNEVPLEGASKNFLRKVHKITDTCGIDFPEIKKSKRGNHVAYVWRTNFFGKHRLVLGESFFLLTDYQQECVINHECAHIKRDDWLKSEWLYLICAAFWWIFPVWMLKNRADMLAEQACDDAFVEGKVSNGQSTKKVYSKLLLSLSSNNPISSMPEKSAKNMTTAGTGSEFFNRVLRVLARYEDRDPVSRKSTSILLLSITLMCSPILMVNIGFIPKPFLSTVSNDDYVVLEGFQIKSIPSNPIDKSVLFYSGLPVPKKSVEYFDVDSESFNNVSTSIEELFTQVEFEPAAFQNDLFLPRGGVQVVGFLPKRLVLPEFPESARQEKISGEVTVTFSVDANGRVRNIEFVRSNPIGVFEDSIIAALDQFWFESSVGELQALSFYFQI